MKRSVQCCLAITAILGMLPLASCKKDEPPPPLPSAAPQAAPAPQPVELQPLAEVTPDAAPAPETKKVGKATAKPASIAACCAALDQNAANAPEPNATYMKQAAAFCRAQGTANPAIVSTIVSILKTAHLPDSCK
jgi:hypothetical protein